MSLRIIYDMILIQIYGLGFSKIDQFWVIALQPILPGYLYKPLALLDRYDCNKFNVCHLPSVLFHIVLLIFVLLNMKNVRKERKQ